MSSFALSGVPLLLLAGLVFMALGVVVASVVAFALAPRLEQWEPRNRHRMLTLIAGLPVVTASALMLSTMLPALASLFVPALDHCATHDDIHAHLCFVHHPHTVPSTPFVLLLVFVLTYVAIRALLALARMQRSLRVVAALHATGEERRDLGATVIETPVPMCLAAGVLRPRVLITRGLIDVLSDAERAVVLAHEHAHVRRRDTLVAGIVRSLCVLHFPVVARWLEDELAIAAEQACDEEAATLSGDRLAVAAVILRVERIVHELGTDFGWAAVAFGPRAIERRVESLLNTKAPTGSLRMAAGCLLVAFLCVVAAAPDLHHATESLLSLVAH